MSSQDTQDSGKAGTARDLYCVAMVDAHWLHDKLSLQALAWKVALVGPGILVPAESYLAANRGWQN